MSTTFESDNPTAHDVHDALTNVHKAAADLVDVLNQFENDEAESVAPVLAAIECWHEAKKAARRQIKRAAFLFDDLDMPVDRRPSTLLSGELQELGRDSDILTSFYPPSHGQMRSLLVIHGHDYFQGLSDRVLALRGHCDKLTGFLDRPVHGDVRSGPERHRTMPTTLEAFDANLDNVLHKLLPYSLQSAVAKFKELADNVRVTSEASNFEWRSYQVRRNNAMESLFSQTGLVMGEEQEQWVGERDCPVQPLRARLPNGTMEVMSGDIFTADRALQEAKTHFTNHCSRITAAVREADQLYPGLIEQDSALACVCANETQWKIDVPSWARKFFPQTAEEWDNEFATYGMENGDIAVRRYWSVVELELIQLAAAIETRERDNDGGSAVGSRASRMTREEADAKVAEIIQAEGWPGSLRQMADEVGCSHELVRGCPSAQPYIDRKHPRPKLDTTGEDVASVTDPAADPLEAMVLREDLEDLDKMLKALPAGQRQEVEGATPQRQRELVEAWKSQKRDEKDDSREKYELRRQEL